MVCMGTETSSSPHHEELHVLITYYIRFGLGHQQQASSRGVCSDGGKKSAVVVQKGEKTTPSSVVVAPLNQSCQKNETNNTSSGKKKEKIVNKSTLVFEIKPYDINTNLDNLEKLVRNIQMDGLEWAKASKKIPIAFGLQKLQIGAIIIDDLISTDDIIEKIEILGLSDDKAAEYIERRARGDDEEEEEYEGDDDDEDQNIDGRMVQSAEIVSFQKL